MVLNVLDATARPTNAVDRPGALVVVNKTDQPSSWDFRSLDAIEISARTGAGLEKLRREIHRCLGVVGPNDSRPCWWTERQKALIAESIRDSRPLDLLKL